METKRQRQAAELVKRNFSLVLQQEGSYIYGPEPLVTVTIVKMTPDLGQAKIYLSVFNTENKQAVLLEMEEEIVRLRQSLANRIKRHIRRIPEIAFFADDTLDEMYRVDALFNRLYEEDQMGEEE
ncbi:MAG: 30S ribosome-binding factor RbfA [Saprospiraceae bacterium]|nr:30S ribosome-binding factor RbfA [Lewinella sp.]